MQLSEKIRSYREYLGFSVADLSSALCASLSAVEEIEKGLRVPNPEEILTLGRLFGINPIHLTNGDSFLVSKGAVSSLDSAIELSEHDLSEFGKYQEYLRQTQETR